jgi:DNA-binding MarR family transcriptional regulator
MYLGLIASLTPKELMVALSLYKAQPETRDELWKTWKDQASAELQIDESDLSITLSRVASSGLIELVTAVRDERGRMWMSMPESGEAGWYRVAPAFEKLMRFLFPA